VKIRPVGDLLFHAEGRTDGDMAKIIVAFGNYAKAPKKPIILRQGMNCNPSHFKNDGELQIKARHHYKN
jgi:hypothetical protein